MHKLLNHVLCLHECLRIAHGLAMMTCLSMLRGGWCCDYLILFKVCQEPTALYDCVGVGLL